MYTDRDLLILKSSVPLCRVNEQKLPESSASGCLIDYGNQRILLTVEHATGDCGKWGIQVEFNKSTGTTLYLIGAMNFLASCTLNFDEITDIDFSYAVVPQDFQAQRQDINEQQEIIKSYPIKVFSVDFGINPNTEDDYGFAGLVKGQLEMHPLATFFASELKIYDKLKYIRTDGDTHVFKLPFKHPGHVEFKGCSGAPILNSDGIPVALLTAGCMKNNEIYGVSLNKYRTPIDILVGNI